MRAWIDAVLSVTLAPVCAACDEPLDQPTRGAVCARCWASIPLLTPPLCDGCGDPLATWRTTPSARCPRCRRAPRLFSSARAIGAYDGALRQIVHALKYQARRSLARPLGALMATHGAAVLSGAAAVVPVPLHPSRQRSRGFNQADDLARAIGAPLVRALVRTRPTSDQVALPAAQRHRNVRDAFAPTAAARTLSGSIVVLVDDVLTTGATLDACAHALTGVGVREVRALTAARVPTAPR